MTITVSPIQAAEALADMVWDVVGNHPDAPDKNTLRTAAGRCLVASWRTPRVPHVELARTLAYAALAWADGVPNSVEALRVASRDYEQRRIRRT